MSAAKQQALVDLQFAVRRLRDALAAKLPIERITALAFSVGAAKDRLAWVLDDERQAGDEAGR